MIDLPKGPLRDILRAFGADSMILNEEVAFSIWRLPRSKGGNKRSMREGLEKIRKIKHCRR